MKVHMEVEMTPEEARKVMGLPDVSKMQEKMMVEMQKRMSMAMNGKDPDAMLKAWDDAARHRAVPAFHVRCAGRAAARRTPLRADGRHDLCWRARRAGLASR